MAAKRSATSELNHDNWEKEDEPEERGTFKMASEDALKRRTIKTARRRNPIREESETKSAFVGFTGFSSKPASADFSFLKDAAPKTNGIGSQDTSKPNLNINPFAQSNTGFTFGSTAPTTTSSNTASTDNQTVPKFSLGASEPDKYYSRLKSLNESVAKWITKKVEENPLISLQPIFKDYNDYLAEIESEGAPKKPDNFANSTPAFNFIVPSTKNIPESTSEKSGATTAAPSTGSFIFGATANAGGASKSFSSLSSTSPLAPTLSFGSNTQPTSGSGTFSGNFNFGSATPKPVSENDHNEDAEDEPPKVEVTPVVEKDYIYTVRCKVFVKKGADYVDRGVGNLYLKSIENSEKIQLIVRADTNLGNLLLNFILSESVPVKRLGKKDVMVVAIPTPDEKPPPTPLLLRVKSPEEADNLLDTLERNKK